jgi:hypothetical protein
VIDGDLLEGLEEPLQQPGGVLLAVASGESAAGIAGALGEVEVADVTKADDRAALPGW